MNKKNRTLSRKVWNNVGVETEHRIMHLLEEEHRPIFVRTKNQIEVLIAERVQIQTYHALLSPFLMSHRAWEEINR